MKRLCILTGTEFETTNREDLVCPTVADAIVDIVTRDKSLRRRVSADILGDAEIMTEVAKAVLSVDATEVGLSAPGTISEFFLGVRTELAHADSH
jgi:hypothetical protein